MGRLTWKQLLILGVAIYAMLMFLLPTSCFDCGWWNPWMQASANGRMFHVFEDTLANYPPISLYTFAAVEKGISLFGMGIQGNEYLIKLVPLAADVALLLIAIAVVQRLKLSKYWLLLVIPNLSIWYNTLIFGQLEQVYVVLGLAAVLTAWEKKLWWSVWLFVLAINVKLIAALFILILVPLWLPLIIKAIKQKAWHTPALNILGLIWFNAILWLPFIFISGWHNVYDDLLGPGGLNQFPFISNNAFNFWAFVYPQEQFKLPMDTQVFGLPISVRDAGLLMWGSVVLIATAWVGWLIYKRKLQSFLPRRKLAIYLAWATIVLSSFFLFNARMHERYIHAGFILALFTAFVSKRPATFIFFSAAYLLNSEWVVRAGTLKGIYAATWFNSTTAAVLYLIGFVFLWVELYLLSRKKSHNIDLAAKPV
jgi:Gpi18-like mannosyltransferase